MSQDQKIDKRSRAYKDSLKEAGEQNNVQQAAITATVDTAPGITDYFQQLSQEPLPEVVKVQDTVPIITQEPIREPIKQQYMEPAVISNTKIPAAVELVRKVRGLVSIKPFVTEEPNMGHEKYNEVLFPNTQQMDTVFCLVRDNIKTYTTGLNEFSADVQSILDQDKKLAKIKYIREIVAYMENVANANFKVSPADCMVNYGKTDSRGQSIDTFWDNVGMFKSVCVDTFDAKGNRVLTYWDRLTIVLDNDGRTLNLNDVHDLAIYHVIQAGGFGLIAPSLQIAMNDHNYNFYLHKVEDVAGIKTEFKILKNKASGYLETMRNTSDNRLFFMAVMCAPVGANQYKTGGFTSTPVLQMYLDLDNYLDGKNIVPTKEAVDKFLEYYEMNIDELTIRSYIKVATELRLIDLMPGGQLQYLKERANLGKNIEDIVTYMMNPVNDPVRESLEKVIINHWAKD